MGSCNTQMVRGPIARPASFSPETRAHFRSVNVQSHGTHCAAAEDHNRGPQPVCTGDVWGAVGHGWGGSARMAEQQARPSMGQGHLREARGVTRGTTSDMFRGRNGGRNTTHVEWRRGTRPSTRLPRQHVFLDTSLCSSPRRSRQHTGTI